MGQAEDSSATVKAPIGDNLFFHQAIDMAQEGDVIVVDGGSGCNRSLAEEIMLRVACKKGSVVDGCLRDLDGKNVAFLGSYSELYH